MNKIQKNKQNESNEENKIGKRYSQLTTVNVGKLHDY